eukprot:scaffold9921_cov112-Isochrysis_galbana.AAC.1
MSGLIWPWRSGSVTKSHQPSVRPKKFVDDEEAPLAEEPVTVAQRVADEGRGVQHVGGDGKVKGVRGEALQARIRVNVQQLIAHEGGVL